VRIWELNGRLVYHHEPLGLPLLDPATLAGENQRYETVRMTDGTSLRLYAEPMLEKGKTIGFIQVGRSETEIQTILDELRVRGIVVLALALALAWVGGRFLARRALEPVDRITRAAERIGAEDLSQRLVLRLPDDELGRLATAFNEMIERLDQAFQRQRRFTADASHELRTPLAVIRSQADLARERQREPAYDTRAFTSIYEESERLGRLVESLLTLARADTSEGLKLVPLDLEELIADLSEHVAPRAQEQSIQLVVQIDEAPESRGDVVWLTQLLLNLVDNALRHTPVGGRLTISLHTAPGGVRLQVADTGEGIPPEHLPHIHERFYRVDHARNRATGGTGLGLAICDWIARAHGGRLEMASQVGRGTTVSLWLPEVKPVAGPANGTAQHPARPFESYCDPHGAAIKSTDEISEDKVGAASRPR
jgi:heavy metal sensor kinase